MPDHAQERIAAAHWTVWVPTPRLRWFRPKRGTDNDMVLQQCWIEQGGGGVEWRTVPIELAD